VSFKIASVWEMELVESSVELRVAI
jgi:hypothetical protein